MENQEFDKWPQKSKFCERHTFPFWGWTLQVIAISAFFGTYLLYPVWYLALIGICMLLAHLVLTLVFLYEDHRRIVRLRRMYEEYFDYCFAQKRLMYQMEQKMKGK